MIRYVPAAAAEALTQALYALHRPPAVRDPGEITTALFPWMTDTRGNRWLAVDTAFTIRVHEEAVLGGIAPILQPWLDEGLLHADTNDELEALIVSQRGQPLVVYDAFPQLFKDQSKTREELQTAGLWSTLEQP
jgi:hypothetical protein